MCPIEWLRRVQIQENLIDETKVLMGKRNKTRPEFENVSACHKNLSE